MGKEYIKIGFSRDIENPKDRRLFRFLEILPGTLSWLTLILVIFLSWQKPVWIAIFIICFDIYWFFRLVILSIYQINSYKKTKRNFKIDWIDKLEKLPIENCKPASPTGGLKIENWRDIYHLIILPTYKEKLEIVRPTFSALINSKYPLDRFIVVLAIEEMAGEQAQILAEEIKKEFGDKFFRFLITVHPKDIEGELAGKGSNETWAGRIAKKEIIDLLKIPYESIIVSSFDIDTQAYPYYFACLTYHYLTCDKPFRSSFQPVPLFNNNIWDAPAISRVMAMGSTFWHMTQQERTKELYTYSSHSMSFKAIVEMDFWPVKNVNEDSRIFWQAFLFYDGDYETIPLYYPVSMDANLAETFWQTVKNVFRQQTRWSWGVENLPYYIFGAIKNKAMPLKKKLYHAFNHGEAFWSWATNSILLFFLGWLPVFLGGERFNVTILSYNLPRTTQTIMTVMMFGLILSAFYGLRLLPPLPPKYRHSRYVWMVLQWMLIPVAMIVLGAIPALVSQTRLMFGKYMGFWVTHKERKK